jgi:hypothetical protein
MYIHFTQHDIKWGLAYSTIHSRVFQTVCRRHYFFLHHTGCPHHLFTDIIKPSGMFFSTHFLNATVLHLHLPQARHPARKFVYSWKYGGYGF